MKKKVKSTIPRPLPPSRINEKSYRIRFRDSDQLTLIKKAAKQQGIPFNTFVIEVCERTADVLLNKNPRDQDEILTTAINASLTER